MSIFNIPRKWIIGIQNYDNVLAERDKYYSELVGLKKVYNFAPPGHYYSPIPSTEEIQKYDVTINKGNTCNIMGIDFHETEQLLLLTELANYYPDIPFHAEKTEGLRYYFENPAYSYSDAIILHCMIRHNKPQKIIEIGSGFSSCVTLDTNELFFDNSIVTTFIEPYPDLLLSLINGSDSLNAKIIPNKLQDIDLAEFEALRANDILFIDSTHVSKFNSDVNRIFFEILPKLAEGIYIHFHDIFFPFEYPKAWLLEGRAWNEAYMLRAFLQYNNTFELFLMNTYMEYFHEPFFEKYMPLCLKNRGGSIWIRKILKEES